MTDSRTADRLARELHDAARRLPVEGTAISVIERTARRRQYRRRRAVAVTSVVAVAGGGVVAIRELSGSGAGDRIISPTDSAIDASLPPDTAPSPTATLAPDRPASGEVAMVPAELVEPDMVWRVVEPDAASAVSIMYSNSQGPRIPGVVMSTAPGRSDEGRQAFYRSDDGITWTQIFPTSPPVGAGRTWGWSIWGDRIYSFATSPGVAASTPNPLRAAVSDDAGATWRTVELPIDTNALASLPGPGGHLTSINGTIANDVGVLVIVSSVATLDPSDVGVDDPDRIGFGRLDDEGALVPTAETQACFDDLQDSESPASTVPALGSVGGAAVANPYDSCYAFRTWEELGVPAERAQAIVHPRLQAFLSSDGTTFREVALPAELSGTRAGIQPLGSAGDRFVLTTWTEDGNRSFVSSDGETWQELTVNGLQAEQVLAVGGSYVATGYAGATGRAAIGVVAADGSAQLVDPASLLDPLELSGYAVGASDGTTATLAVNVGIDTVAAAGGFTDTVNGITRRLLNSTSAEQFVDADGTPLPPEHVRYSNDGASVVVVDDSGATIAEFDQRSWDQRWSDAAEQHGSSRWVIRRTSDGLRWSQESVAELLGVDDADITSVQRVHTVGEQVIVAVNTKPLTADGVPRQVVLVGTPKG